MARKFDTDNAMVFDLRAFYARTGMTQKEIAEALGVNKTTLHRFQVEGKVPKVYLWALVGIEKVLLAEKAAEPPPVVAPMPTQEEIAVIVDRAFAPPPPAFDGEEWGDDHFATQLEAANASRLPTFTPPPAEPPKPVRVAGERPAVLPEDYDEVDARITEALNRKMAPVEIDPPAPPPPAEELRDEFGPLDPNDSPYLPRPVEDEFTKWALGH